MRLRPLSSVARELLDELRRASPRSILASFFSKQPAVDILRRLSETGELSIVPHIAPYAASTSSAIATAARGAVGALLSNVAAEDLPALDEAVRASWYASETYGPVQVSPDHILRRDKQGAPILSLLSFHPSGYVREAAVNRLALLNDGSELPYLLLRLTDWVAQVRAAARAAALNRMRDDYVESFARSFSMVLRVIRAHRVDQAELLGPLTRLFATPRGQSAAVEVITAGSRQSGRALVEILVDPDLGDLAAIVRAGLTSVDDVIRRRVVRVAAQVLPPAEALAALQRLAADRSPAVRRESLLALVQSFPAVVREHLQRGVLDGSASVRETSRVLLRDAELDFAAMYRTAMNSVTTPRQLAAAMAGLAEVGTASDAPSAVAYLAHSSAKVRRAAVRCVMRLDGGTLAERVAGMLQDSSPAVSAAARDTLKRHAASLGPPELSRIFVESRLRHSRLNVIHVMAALPKWQSITCLIQAADVDDEAVASLARAYVRHWNRHYNRSQASPSRRELHDLEAALSRGGAALADDVAEIRFAVQPFASR